MSSSEQKYRLVLITEGDVEDVIEFDTIEERDAFSVGFTTGANCYGAGSAFGVEYPEETNPNMHQLEPGLLSRVKAAGRRGTG